MTEQGHEPEPEREQTSDRPTLRSLIGRLVVHVDSHASNGELADLRRAGTDAPYSPALWKLLALVIEPAGILSTGPRRDEDERRWSTILNALALTKGLHSHEHTLGAALASAGFSELRFVRLLEARDETLNDHLRLAAQFLASKGVSADWSDGASLVLYQDPPNDEKARRGLARAYYTTLHKEEKHT